MRTTKCTERFSSTELLGLQCDLLQVDIDARQAADMLAAFLNGRGYGVDAKLAEESIHRLDGAQCDMATIQLELERVALVM